MTIARKPVSPLLAAALTQLALVETEISIAEERLKDRKAFRKYIGENVLAELITHEQLNDGATLPDGTDVTFEVEYHATIPAKERDLAHAWLVTEGLGDLLKTEITISVPKGDIEKAVTIATFLDLLSGVEVSTETTLPGPTLMKLVRERLAAGQSLPTMFGVYAPVRAIPVGTTTMKRSAKA